MSFPVVFKWCSMVFELSGVQWCLMVAKWFEWCLMDLEWLQMVLNGPFHGV